MKLMLPVHGYGGRAQVLVGNRHALYFRGKQPPIPSLITVDLPRLRSDDPDRVIAWLSKRARAQGVAGTFGKVGGKHAELSELDEALWRPAVLDDVMTAHNWRTVVWATSQYFPPEDFAAFAAAYRPLYEREMAKVAGARGRDRVRAIERLDPRFERVCYISYLTQSALQRDRNDLLQALDAERMREMRSEPYALERWLRYAKQLGHPSHQQLLLREIAEQLARNGSSADAERALGEIRAVTKLHGACHGDALFWQHIARVLELPANAEGLEVDVGNAVEVTVSLSWDVIDALRIGPIAHGRSALIAMHGTRRVYIRGERKLKFRLQRAGGRLAHHGNILTMPVGRGVSDALLTVERIDTLANTAPRQALALAAHLDLPPAHEVFDAAARVADDPRYGRVLADLLIELLVGIDADVARRLARAQARANRR